MTTQEILKRAKIAKAQMGSFGKAEINRALSLMADALIKDKSKILCANAIDCEAAKDKLSSVMIDRLMLSEERINTMAQGVRELIALPYPIGDIIESTERPNGLLIDKVCVPMGVVAIIYESRPNVTSDAAALSLKSGNVSVLRGGKDSYKTSRAIVDTLRSALADTKIPIDAIQLIDDTSRESAREIMRARGYVDLLIPRGGKGLISSCVENATVPCIETGTGICHIYVDSSARLDMALSIIENAKTQRPSVCNAAEVCLVAEDIAPVFLPMLKERLAEKRAVNPVQLICDDGAHKIIGGTLANDADFDTEFLDYKLAVALVPDVKAAVAHISRHSTQHSEAIITESRETADYFTSNIDSAAVYVNASTRFTDGGVFGLGCEMGISTQKMHARGPMGIRELTTYKYIIRGNGQIR